MSRYWENPQPIEQDSGSENWCRRCGGHNPIWCVDSDRFNAAVEALGLLRSIIICPGCFAEGHERATGMVAVWELTPHAGFRWREDIEE